MLGRKYLLAMDNTSIALHILTGILQEFVAEHSAVRRLSIEHPEKFETCLGKFASLSETSKELAL